MPLMSEMEGCRLQHQSLVFQDGFWWYVGFGPLRRIRLDAMFRECGWKVGRLGKSLGLERRTFARMVKQSLGINGKTWLRQLRAVEACHLLREEGKINAIAHRLGFRDDSDFAREFREHIGMSPAAYRKAERTRDQSYC